MTTSLYSPKTYVADGTQKDFAFDWPVYDSDDLNVYLIAGDVEELQTVFTYTVSGIGNQSGGYVQFFTAPSSNYNVYIETSLIGLQTTDFENNSILLAENIESALDNLSISIQECFRKYDRTLKVPLSESTIGYLPILSERMNRLACYDIVGNPSITSITESQISSLYPVSGTATYFTVIGTISGSASYKLRPDDSNYTKAWDITANDAGDLQFINYATGSGVSVFTLGATTSGNTTYSELVDGVLTLTDTITTLSGAYNSISNTVDSLTSNLAFSNYWATTLSGIYSDIFLKGVDTLDDVPDGVTYSKVLSTAVEAGLIKLSGVYGNMDDIVNGSDYGKVRLTALSDGQILLLEAIGDLDDIANGGTYAKTLSTCIDAGYIYMLRREGSSTNTVSITTNSIEGYVDGTKSLEVLIGGEVRLGNQSSLWSKQSSTGFYLYNISTPIASFTASAATVGQTAYGHGVFGTSGLEFNVGASTLFSIDLNGYHSSTQPYFVRLADNSQSNVTGDGTTYTCVWYYEDIDQGNNCTSTTFTAPCDGTYHFNIIMRISGLALSTEYSGILTLVTTQKSFAADMIDTNFSLNADVVLAEGDTAYVTLRIIGGSKTVDILGSNTQTSLAHTWFSGRLVC